MAESYICSPELSVQRAMKAEGACLKQTWMTSNRQDLSNGAACQGQGTCCCPTTGSTQRQARAAPNHRHRQHPTAGTGREEAATTTGASPRRATGTEKHPFPGQSQASPSHGTEPNRQWAMGKRQTKGKSIPGRLDRLPDCQATDRHAGDHAGISMNHASASDCKHRARSVLCE